MPKKYDVQFIQAFFDNLNFAHLGEATGKDLANLLIALDWHEDDDIYRTATNCLAWIRKRVRFEESEEGLSPSTMVKACVEHINKVRKDRSNKEKDGGDGDRDEEEAAQPEPQPRLAKTAAKAKMPACARPEKSKPMVSAPVACNNTTVGPVDRTFHLENQLMACKQDIMILHSQVQTLEQQMGQAVQEILSIKQFCYEMMGSVYGNTQGGAQAAPAPPIVVPETQTEGNAKGSGLSVEDGQDEGGVTLEEL